MQASYSVQGAIHLLRDTILACFRPPPRCVIWWHWHGPQPLPTLWSDIVNFPKIQAIKMACSAEKMAFLFQKMPRDTLVNPLPPLVLFGDTVATLPSVTYYKLLFE